MARAQISPARRAAYKILSQVAKEKAFTSILLPFYEEELGIEDRTLCHQITLGVIRNQIYLDRILESFSQKKAEKLDLPVLLALRMGLYQMYFLTRIPAHAAINESVELVRRAKLTSATGLVNAVLRRAQKESEFNPSAGIEDDFERVSVQRSHPRWLLERWAAQFGFVKTEKLAEANNYIPAMKFRLNGASNDEVLDELLSAGVQFQPTKFAAGCFVVMRASKLLYEFGEQGKIVFQDEGSQIVAGLVKLDRGESFFDVCAAPGNKATQIIGDARARQVLSGDAIYAAGDIYPPRLAILEQSLARAGIDNVKVLKYDAEKILPFEAETFDKILLDAPCSGTGTIRHNPEIRFSLKPGDFAELAEKQKKILSNASRLLKRGGKLVYSTCSLEEEENEAVVEEFLRENANFEIAEFQVDRDLVTERGFLRTFPHRHKTDGFFAAVLKRVH